MARDPLLVRLSDEDSLLARNKHGPFDQWVSVAVQVQPIAKEYQEYKSRGIDLATAMLETIPRCELLNNFERMRARAIKEGSYQERRRLFKESDGTYLESEFVTRPAGPVQLPRMPKKAQREEVHSEDEDHETSSSQSSKHASVQEEEDDAAIATAEKAPNPESDQAALEAGLQIIQDGVNRALEDDTNFSGREVQLDDPLLKAIPFPLQDHQREGVGLLQYLEDKYKGWLMCDDMGMGKTIQGIATVIKDRLERLERIKAENSAAKDRKPTLIICPPTLVIQWKAELNKCKLKYLDHTQGSKLATKKSTSAEFCKYDVVLTTVNRVRDVYKAILNAERDQGLARYGFEEFQRSTTAQRRKQPKQPKPEKVEVERVYAALFAFDWHRVIIDEGHRIRNTETATFAAVCALKAKYRGVLTGTPLQNDYSDLFALLCFLGLFPWSDYRFFRRVFIRKQPGKQSGRAALLGNDLNLCLAAIYRAVSVRRLKGHLFNGVPTCGAPDLSQEFIPIQLTPAEQKIQDEGYAYWRDADKKHRELTKSKGIKGKDEIDPATTLAQLQRLQILAIHLGAGNANYGDTGADDGRLAKPLSRDLQLLLGGAFDGEDAQQDVDMATDERDNVKVEDDHRSNREKFREKMRQDQNWSSSKIKQAVKMIKHFVAEYEENLAEIEDPVERMQFRAYNKIIIFSPFLAVLDALAMGLEENEIEYLELNGHVTGGDRERTIRTFEEKDDDDNPIDFAVDGNEPSKVRVMLASLRVAAEGLNLPHGSKIIMLTLSWNPFLDAQAFSRAYRIGQPYPVETYYLYAASSLDRRIHEVQGEKMTKIAKVMDQKALSQNAKKMRSWDVDFLRNLIRVKGADGELAKVISSQAGRQAGEEDSDAPEAPRATSETFSD
ncbi:transcription termination factor, RNA polymerase II [Elasticomyces elasticus]|nr:transcription termination factor, RNA polymerase II [Elasticomyces elasticus]